MITKFQTIDTEQALQTACDQLAAIDTDIDKLLKRYSYPPLWHRPNTFESLLHIILEQQVSLASALSALNKLRQRVGKVTPESLLALNDAELHEAYFSRQKTSYARGLAQAIQSGALDLSSLTTQPDDVVRQQLTAIKGIGNWTTDIYLIMVLQRPDIFPFGDLAAVKALQTLKGILGNRNSAEFVSITDAWRPYRSAATMMLWHQYLSQRGMANGA